MCVCACVVNETSQAKAGTCVYVAVNECNVCVCVCVRVL